MSLPPRAELEATAAAYERRLVPALFAEWAERVADEARLRPGQRVLDVACGTGVLARAAAARVGAGRSEPGRVGAGQVGAGQVGAGSRAGGGSVVGLDANPAMLAVAARADADVEWRQGEAHTLPFTDGSFDAVLSQFGLMLFPDRVAALREMARVLTPGGRGVVAVLASLDTASLDTASLDTASPDTTSPDTNAGYAAFARALRPFVDPAITAAPFSLGERDALLELARESELPGASVTTGATTARFASVRDLVLADVEGWFPLAGIHLTSAQVDELVERASEGLDDFTAAEGAVAFPLTAHLLTWGDEVNE